MNLSIGIVGGDLRQKHMADTFESPVSYFANDKIGKSIKNTMFNDLEDFIASNNIIITPIPFTKDKMNIYAKYTLKQIPIDKFLSCIVKDQVIIGGPFSNNVRNDIREKNASFVDITTIEQFKEKNAIPTCEGVISKMIISSDITLNNSKTLILGYGQCGKRIAKTLKHLGSHISIFTENYEEIEMLLSDYFPYTIDLVGLNKYDYIINTIPKKIVLKESVDSNNLFIDITNIYNFDMNNFIEMRGIPGRYSPKTSGIVIGNVIEKIIGKLEGEGIY